MTERARDWYLDLSPDAEIEEFVKTLEHQADNPPNGDIYIQALVKSMIIDWPKFEPSIRLGFAFRREEIEKPINPHIYPNLVERAIFSQARKNDPEAWPIKVDADGVVAKTYSKVWPYRRLFPKFLPKPAEDPYFNEFIRDISLRNIQSNKADRAKAEQLLLVGFADRLPKRPQIGDFGCSANHWLAALVTKHRLSDLEVMAPDDSGKLVVDTGMTKLIDQALNVHPDIGPSVGFDEWPFFGGSSEGEDSRRWAMDCSLIPSELAQSVMLEHMLRSVGHTALEGFISPRMQYTFLDSVRDPLVGFAWMDATDSFQVEQFRKSPAEKYPAKSFDIVNEGTAMYFQTKADRKVFLDTMRSFRRKNNSLMVVTDYCRPDPDDPHELLFEDDIYDHPWSYRTLVYDPENQAGWQEIFIWENGRCRRVQLGKGAIMVNGQPRTISEQLLDLAA